MRITFRPESLVSRADILVKLITISFVVFSHPVAAPVLQQKQPGAAVLINSSGSVQIGCIGCVLTPPNNPTVFIDCTPESGEDPFFYQWFVQFNETDDLLRRRDKCHALCDGGRDIYMPSRQRRQPTSRDGYHHNRV